jgi:hypothetical protein
MVVPVILNVVYLVVGIGLVTLMATWIARIWAWIRELRNRRKPKR